MNKIRNICIQFEINYSPAKPILEKGMSANIFESSVRILKAKNVTLMKFKIIKKRIRQDQNHF